MHLMQGNGLWSLHMLQLEPSSDKKHHNQPVSGYICLALRWQDWENGGEEQGKGSGAEKDVEVNIHAKKHLNSASMSDSD